MNLTIDIGNTRTKIALFNKNSEIHSEIYQKLDIDDLKKIKKQYHAIQNIIISSTSKYNKKFIEQARQLFKVCIEFTSHTPLPFTTEYKTRETIGLDRLAGIAGAQNLFPNKTILIIEAGTAISYDLLISDSIHKGGNISPGMMMRFKALNAFTHRLPLVSPHNNISPLGVSTDQAILNGVINGIQYEIDGCIDHFRLIYEDLTVLITGGDAEFFEIKLKNSIFVVQNLVQTGLNIILNHNVEEI